MRCSTAIGKTLMGFLQLVPSLMEFLPEDQEIQLLQQHVFVGGIGFQNSRELGQVQLDLPRL